MNGLMTWFIKMKNTKFYKKVLQKVEKSEGNISLIVVKFRHDFNPRFSKSLSHIKIYYSLLTPIISCLLTVNTMLLTRSKWDRQYWYGDVSFQTRWLSQLSIMPGLIMHFIVSSFVKFQRKSSFKIVIRVEIRAPASGLHFCKKLEKG